MLLPFFCALKYRKEKDGKCLLQDVWHVISMCDPRDLWSKRCKARSRHVAWIRIKPSKTEGVARGVWRGYRIYLQRLKAVSKPIFATEHSLESSWRDLSDLHPFAPLLITQKTKYVCPVLFCKICSSTSMQRCFQENRFLQVLRSFRRDFRRCWLDSPRISQIF